MEHVLFVALSLLPVTLPNYTRRKRLPIEDTTRGCLTPAHFCSFDFIPSSITGTLDNRFPAAT
jgi:hypothetical protein